MKERRPCQGCVFLTFSLSLLTFLSQSEEREGVQRKMTLPRMSISNHVCLHSLYYVYLLAREGWREGVNG